MAAPKSGGEAPPPIIAFSQSPDGGVQACRVRFEPIETIAPSDIFQNGIITYSARTRYPHVGNRLNDVWFSLVTKGDQIMTIHICDYITWNTPIALQVNKGVPRIRHCCGMYPAPATGFIANGDAAGDADRAKTKACLNYNVIVPAANFGYDKCIVFKFYPYSGGVIDLDQAAAGGASIYTGFLDFGRKTIERMPMSNIHDQGKLCLTPVGSASSFSPLPNAIFKEFTAAYGNLDLAYDTPLQHLFLEPVEDSEQEDGVPWLEFKTESPGQRFGGMSMTVPDFWSRFSSEIAEFKAAKANPRPTKVPAKRRS